MYTQYTPILFRHISSSFSRFRIVNFMEFNEILFDPVYLIVFGRSVTVVVISVIVIRTLASGRIARRRLNRTESDGFTVGGRRQTGRLRSRAVAIAVSLRR